MHWIGHVHRQLDRTDSILIYVGGLPEIRRWPFEYRAVFSPTDVIAEYTRPARVVEHGEVVVKEYPAYRMARVQAGKAGSSSGASRCSSRNRWPTPSRRTWR